RAGGSILFRVARHLRVDVHAEQLIAHIACDVPVDQVFDDAVDARALEVPGAERLVPVPAVPRADQDRAAVGERAPRRQAPRDFAETRQQLIERKAVDGEAILDRSRRAYERGRRLDDLIEQWLDVA